ncbi:ExbD/TolR family protein [Novosphingobium terrae]|uniref:ExbD/TolR family protein n=1 Tax=Novosphingobium terrae TaxID=2726189 RepID=UPI00197D1CDE|nr:hypothetical protein [Novosphingobium terrae]
MRRINAFLLCLMLCASGSEAKTKTYSQGCGARPAGWITPRQGRSIWNEVIAISVSADGASKFNGTGVSRSELQANMKLARNLEPTVIVQAKFDPATDCKAVSEIRKMMSQTLDCQHGQCAEGEGHWWLIGDVGRNPQPYDPEAAPKSAERP